MKRLLQSAALVGALVATIACDRPPRTNVSQPKPTRPLPARARAWRDKLPPKLAEPFGAVIAAARVREEHELADKEKEVAAARADMDRILKLGQITDPDPSSMDAEIQVSPGANLPNGGKAAVDEYLERKANYLGTLVLLKAIRAQYLELWQETEIK